MKKLMSDRLETNVPSEIKNASRIFGKHFKHESRYYFLIKTLCEVLEPSFR